MKTTNLRHSVAVTALLSAALAQPIPRAVRGGVMARTPEEVLAELQANWATFKSENDAALKGKADVVVDEKLGRVEASVTELQGTIDKMNAEVAALRLNGADDNVIGDIKADPEYMGAFKAHMRKGDVQAALTKGTAEEGGYLAPIEWDRSITKKLKETSPIRANARVITISTAGFKKVYSDGVVGSGWVGETASRPATSTPGLAELTFTPGEIYANPQATQQLLDDAAVDLEQWLADEVEPEFERQEGIAFLSGDGANKPFGLLTYVTGAANAAKHPWGAITVKNTGTAALMDKSDALIDLVYSLPAKFRQNAAFYMNRMTQGAARKLKDGQGNYLWQPSYQLGQPATLSGERVVEVPDMPDIAANAIVALYGDMDETYLIVDRIGIRVLRDPYTNKPYVGFYTTKRVGGGVNNPEAMRGLKVAA